MKLLLTDAVLDLSRPRVMGILNVTPDSFSDGGRHAGLDAALAAAREMAAAGAAIVDVGGESTRPGAMPVPVEEELARVLPVVEAIRGELEVPVSIDTSKPEVMRAAVAAGAGMINDVRALRADGALAAAAGSGAAVCLMHMQGEPRAMQKDPRYENVVGEVASFLDERIAACRAAGIAAGRIAIDPGFGFGKRLEHNLTLLDGLPRIARPGVALVAGLSRKAMLGELTGRGLGERAVGSAVLAALAVERGAHIIRAHDVAETMDAVRIATALRERPGHGDGSAAGEDERPAAGRHRD